MLGALIEHDNNEVESEVFLCNVVDSIKSEQNFDLMASSCSTSSSNKEVQLSKENDTVVNDVVNYNEVE